METKCATPFLSILIWFFFVRSVWHSYGLSQRKNKPKEYPNSNDMMGPFLRAGFVWLKHVWDLLIIVDLFRKDYPLHIPWLLAFFNHPSHHNPTESPNVESEKPPLAFSLTSSGSSNLDAQTNFRSPRFIHSFEAEEFWRVFQRLAESYASGIVLFNFGDAFEQANPDAKY